MRAVNSEGQASPSPAWVTFVVLRPGAIAGDELVGELQAHCKRVTAPYKYPREIEFVESLPKTRSGKIRRIELRKLEEARTSAE